MTPVSSTNRWFVTVLAGLAGIALGAGWMYWRGTATPAPAAAPAAAPLSAAMPSGPVAITLASDAQARAGIVLEPVTAGTASALLRVPGRIEPNAYQQVVVTATTTGRVAGMTAEQGLAVTKGQVVGEIYSPDAADQQRVFLSMRAELEAAHAKLARAEELVKLGSVSQQELEATRAAHTTHATDVEVARSRLIFLGVTADRVDRLTSAADISATVQIVSPRSGIVTRRAVNVGQNVESGTELIAIADLSTVWAVADVFERDQARVREGAVVSITSPAIAGATWRAQITYVDPQVKAETRTVQVRAEIPNRDGRLRPGQYVDMTIAGAGGPSALGLAKSAVQTIGARTFVYVADPDQTGRFLEREVRVGATAGDRVEILDGLAAGERVVTGGSFFLRAERDRLGLPLPPPIIVR